MNPSRVRYFAALCVVAVLLVTVFWEFAFEDLVPPFMSLLHGPESFEERLEFILTATGASAIVAMVLSVIASRAISRQSQSEQARRESERRFRDYTETASEWHWEMGPDLRFTSVSEHYKSSTGRRVADVIGKTRDELRDPSAGGEYWDQHSSELNARLAFRDFEYAQRSADGSLAYFSVSGIPLFDSNGDFQGYRGTGRNVTKRKETELALQKSFENLEKRVEQRTAELREANEALKAEIVEREREEERFRRFFSLPLVGSAIYGPDKRWIEVNDKLCDLFGYSSEELRELTWVDVTHPDDLAENLRLFDEAKSGSRDVYSMDKRFIRKNGDILPCSISVECVRHPDGTPEYFMLLVQDLTKRKQAESALRESEDRLRQAVQLSNLGYWIWDVQEDRCAYCSEEFASIHGTAVDDYLSRSSSLDGEFPFTHPDDCEGYRAACKNLSLGQSFDLEYRVVTAQGDIRHVREIARPIFGEDGTVIREHGTIQDITKMKLAEAAIRERDERLRELQSQLIQTSRVSAMGQMSLGLAHELNQPLAAMTNYVGAAKRILRAEGQIDSRASEAIEMAAVQSIRAANIVRSLRRLFESRGINASAQDINEAVEEGVTLALIGTDEKRVSKLLEFAHDLPPAVFDRVQTQQVLLNLIRNSLEATTDAERCELLVKTCRRDDAIEVSVSDNGPGLPQEVKDRLFEPFVTTKPNGMGVGLSICHEIVQAHGSTLRTRSRPEGGTEFSFSLPVAAAAEAQRVNVA